MEKVRYAVLVTALALVTLLLAAPLLASAGYVALSSVVYGAFAPLCHQQVERSFLISGFPLAVCARCFGLYSGFAVGMLLLSVIRVPLRNSPTLLRWLAASFLPLIVDALGGWLGLFENTHFSRFLTGVIGGAGVAYFVAAVLVQSTRPRKLHHKERTLEDNPL